MRIGIYNENKKTEYELFQILKVSPYFKEKNFVFEYEHNRKFKEVIKDIKYVATIPRLITNIVPIEAFINEKRFDITQDQMNLNINSNTFLSLFTFIVCYNKINTGLMSYTDEEKIIFVEKQKPQAVANLLITKCEEYYEKIKNEQDSLLWNAMHRQNNTNKHP